MRGEESDRKALLRPPTLTTLLRLGKESAEGRESPVAFR